MTLPALRDSGDSAAPTTTMTNPTNGQDQGSAAAFMTADVLARVSREALAADGLEAVMQRVVDYLAANLPVAIVSIIQLNDECSHFVREVVAGDLELDAPVPMPWPVTVGAAGRCVRDGTARLIADVETDPDYQAGNPAVRAEYLLPIRHRERLHGVLNIESTQRGFFEPAIRTMFEAVADQIAGIIHLSRVIGELEGANRRLQELSMSDGLTGIANRRCFDQRLEQDWQLGKSTGGTLAVLLIDVDCFKALNDQRGHLYGDDCLRQLARICRRFANPPKELVARFGGEEMILLLPDCSLAEAEERAENLRAAIESARMSHPESPVAAWVTASIGVGAGLPRELESPLHLIDAADRALYRAKSRGRNRVVGTLVLPGPAAA